MRRSRTTSTRGSPPAFWTELQALQRRHAPSPAADSGETGQANPLTVPLLRQLFARFIRYGGAPVLLQTPAQLPEPCPIATPAFFQELEALCGGFRWSLQETDPQPGVVTPAILGALCERLPDRRQLGAYYTATDVAGYICRCTLYARLLEWVEREIDPEVGSRLLDATQPDRYLWEAVTRPGPLPGETPYEFRNRKARHEQLRRAIQSGTVQSADDALTLNLDLQAILLGWIETAAPPRLEAFCRRLEQLSVLDPTCGSGAFLLATLEALLPLYRASRRQDTSELRCCAWIVGHNLYGVDLLPHALEACRMRLLLRVLAAGTADTPREDLQLYAALQPNLHCGNALIGFPLPGEHRQPGGSGNHPADSGLRLLHYLDARGQETPEAVRERLQPLHWGVAFPEVWERGGFDVVVGNPPFVEDREIQHLGRVLGYRTASCGNLYPLVVERSLGLLNPHGRLGMVLPISGISGTAYRPLMTLLRKQNCWISSYSNRPARLFDGVEQRLAVVLTGAGSPPALYMSAYQHWYEEERDRLFPLLTYCKSSTWNYSGMPVKSGTETAERIFQALCAHTGRLGDLEARGTGSVWFHDGPTYWVRALSFAPDLRSGRSTHFHRISVASEETARVLAAVLCSSTFYLFYKMVSNCRDLGRGEWAEFPFNPLPDALQRTLVELGAALETILRETATVRRRNYPSGESVYREYHPALAKSVLDRIDSALAAHFGFSEEELHHILNHDGKYRMGCGRHSADDGRESL